MSSDDFFESAGLEGPVSEIVFRLYRLNKIGGAHTNEEHLRKGVIEALYSDAQIREAVLAMVSRGWLRRHAKGVIGKNDHVSLEAGAIAEAVAFAEKHLPEKRALVLRAEREAREEDPSAVAAEDDFEPYVTRSEMMALLDQYVPRNLLDAKLADVRPKESAVVAAPAKAEDAPAELLALARKMRSDLNDMDNRLRSMREAVDSLKAQGASFDTRIKETERLIIDTRGWAFSAKKTLDGLDLMKEMLTAGLSSGAITGTVESIEKAKRGGGGKPPVITKVGPDGEPLRSPQPKGDASPDCWCGAGGMVEVTLYGSGGGRAWAPMKPVLVCEAHRDFACLVVGRDMERSKRKLVKDAAARWKKALIIAEPGMTKAWATALESAGLEVANIEEVRD